MNADEVVIRHNADDDAYKALPFPACVECRSPLVHKDDDLCAACAQPRSA